MERVTGIEPALSAWEVCGAARVLPGESVTCGDLDGLSASDRDYPWALFPSGTQRARVHPRIKSRARARLRPSESVPPVGWPAVISLGQCGAVRDGSAALPLDLLLAGAVACTCPVLLAAAIPRTAVLVSGLAQQLGFDSADSVEIIGLSLIHI